MAILVVEDERMIGDAVAHALRGEGHEVALARDGGEAQRLIAAIRPQAIVLDVMLPDVDGFEICRRLRESGSRTPVLMLTARDQIHDRVAGLEAGADDYLVKPFAVSELKARVRALLRRSSWNVRGDPLRFDDLQLVSGQARRGSRLIDLTATEYRLLEALLLHADQVLTREAIFERVWGFDITGSSNSLDVYVGYLRRKLEAAGEPRLIHTVRGIGYRLGRS